MTNNVYMHGIPKGKIIRDAVHGDIFVEDKFLKIIDTPEFQRMRRIKQLSVANIVFPSADHTRFSHSLGCFYVMKQIIAHFDSIFGKMGIEVSKQDKDIALLAALLHDIGHGPFSHAFEDIHPKGAAQVSHETWTSRIITCHSGTIYKQIEETFGKGTAEKVSELIEKQRRVKSSEENYIIEKIDIFSVLSSLISSQLDADRLDYLVRDAYNCGVSFGKIDIQRIISALSLTVYDNQYYVCVPEKYIGDIEDYLLARYHMQSVVYYHDMKVQMEQIIQKIFSRAQKLHEENKLPNCPPALDTLFSSHNLQVEDYIRIDDSTFWCAFQSWSESPDVELSDYCLTILNRQKLLKLNALDNTSTAYHRFKEDFCKLLKKHNYTLVTEDSLAESPFWIEKRFVFSAYKPQKENIWIQTAAGFLVDISQQSKIVQLRDDAADEAVSLSDNERVWINRRILETLPLSNMTEFQKALDELIHNYDIRNTIEIEKKYHFSDEAVFQDVLAYLKTRDDVYSFDKSPAFEQVDSYYDTPDKLVESAKSTLRIRHKDCNYEITIKCPTPVQIKDNGQNERFEFCHPISSNSLSGEEAFIVKHVPSLKDKTSELKNTLTIINKREIINILAKKSEAKFEMAFDHVTYQDDSGHKAYDYQIEIELKSDYIHRVNLKMLTDDLERKVSKLESSTESKYKRGLTKLSVQ